MLSRLVKCTLLIVYCTQSDKDWDNVWKKPRVYHGEWSLQVAGLKGFSRGTVHPRLFHIFSFFCHPGPVKRGFLHCCQTQSAPREYHTQQYVEVHRLVNLNPNMLSRHVERMYIVYCKTYLDPCQKVESFSEQCRTR